MSYTTLTDVKGGNWKVPTGINELDIQDTYIPLAEAYINQFTNDNFNSVLHTFYTDGSGTSALYLSKITPLRIVDVSSITDVGGSSEVVVSSDDYKIYDRFIILVEDIEIRASSYLSGGKWVQGNRNYKVIGNFGWSSVPVLISRAAVLLTRMIVENEAEGNSEGLIVSLMKSEKIGDYAYTKADGGDAGKELQSFTGNMEIDTILTRYSNKIIQPLDSGGAYAY